METNTPNGPAEVLTLEQVQYQHAVQVLDLLHGNKLRAAKLLGISRMTLYRLLARNTPTPAVAYPLTSPVASLVALPVTTMTLPVNAPQRDAGFAVRDMRPPLNFRRVESQHPQYLGRVK